MQLSCCTTLKTNLASSQTVPSFCKRKCSSRKDRILIEAHEDIRSNMYAHNVLMLLRVLEGTLKEKLELGAEEWKQAMNRYGPLRIKKAGKALEITDSRAKLD